MRILLLGDIVGQAGCRAVFFGLPSLRRELGVELVVANAENAADGLGLDARIYAELRSAGVDGSAGNIVDDGRRVIDGKGQDLVRQEYLSR